MHLGFRPPRSSNLILDQIDVLVRWNNGVESRVPSKVLEQDSIAPIRNLSLAAGRKVKMRSEEGYVFGTILCVYDQKDVLVRWNNGEENRVSSKRLAQNKGKKQISHSRRLKLEVGEKVKMGVTKDMNLDYVSGSIYGTILYVYNYKNTSDKYSQELNTTNLSGKLDGHELSVCAVEPDDDQSIDCLQVPLSALPEFNNNKRDEDCLENASYCKFGKDCKDKKYEEQPPVEQITQVISEGGNEIEIFDCNSVADCAELVSIEDEEIHVIKQNFSNEDHLNIVVSEPFSLKEDFDDFGKYRKGVKRKTCEEGCETVSEQLIVKNTTSQNESTSLASVEQLLSNKPVRKQEEFKSNKNSQEVTNSYERLVKPCSVFIERNIGKYMKLKDNCAITLKSNTKELQNEKISDLKTARAAQEESSELFDLTVSRTRKNCTQKKEKLKATLKMDSCSKNKELSKNEEHLSSDNVEKTCIKKPQAVQPELSHRPLTYRTYSNKKKHNNHQIHPNLVERNCPRPSSLSAQNLNTSLESEISKKHKDLAINGDKLNNKDLIVSQKRKHLRTDLEISGSNNIASKSVKKYSHSELQSSLLVEHEKVPLTIKHKMKEKDRRNSNKPYHPRAETLKLKNFHSNSSPLDSCDKVESVRKTTANLQKLLQRPNVKTLLGSPEVFQSVIKTTAALQKLLSKSNAVKTKRPDNTNDCKFEETTASQLTSKSSDEKAGKPIIRVDYDISTTFSPKSFLNPNAIETENPSMKNGQGQVPTETIFPLQKETFLSGLQNQTSSSRVQNIILPNYTPRNGLQNIILPNYTPTSGLQNIILPNYTPSGLQNIILPNYISSGGVQNILIPNYTSSRGSQRIILPKYKSSSGVQTILTPNCMFSTEGRRVYLPHHKSSSRLQNSCFKNETSSGKIQNVTSSDEIQNVTSSGRLQNIYLQKETFLSGLQNISLQTKTPSNSLQNDTSSSGLQNICLQNKTPSDGLQNDTSSSGLQNISLQKKTPSDGLQHDTSLSGLENICLQNKTPSDGLQNDTFSSGLHTISLQNITPSNGLQNITSLSNLQYNSITNETQNRILQNELGQSSNKPLRSVDVQLPTNKATNSEEVCASSSLEDCLDGAPPFIRDVLKCDNIRDGFITSDLRFVLSLLPDIEEMTVNQKIYFQLKLIDILNEVLTNPRLQEQESVSSGDKVYCN